MSLSVNQKLDGEAPLVGDPPYATPQLDKINTFDNYHKIITFWPFGLFLPKAEETRPGDLVGAGPNWVTFWSKFGLF